LLVLGYAVKYYLNEQMVIKPYDEEIKLRHPTFFATIFNRWAKKYGNSVLATTPRKINAYYFELAAQLEVDELNSTANNEENCQYRNYNEIVEELIKATTEVEDAGDFDKEPPEE
jgi:transposase-like protein